MQKLQFHNRGFIHFLILAVISLLAGLALHFYNERIEYTNQQLSLLHQEQVVKHKQNNIYYLPENTIAWLAIRQNDKGYFVTNPDLINEPSQLNKNSLRATRYAIATLEELGGLTEIRQQETVDFVLRRYRETNDDEGNIIAGFVTDKGEPMGVRPTMDAILTLKSLKALDHNAINIAAIRRFILSHHNADGGFWDPHYPQYGTHSCLKCTSFALRALGVLNQKFEQSFDEAFINKVTDYIVKSWDPNTESYAEQIGANANDSYDIFRAFISLWNLHNATELEKKSFSSQHLHLTDIKKTLKDKFLTEEKVFSRKISPAHHSMKATHLMVWMHYKLDLLNDLDKEAIIQYVLSHQSSPGEYGGDIYNTYSATGILKKLSVATAPIAAPPSPKFKQSGYPEILPYLLYILSAFLFVIYYLQSKKKLESRANILQNKMNTDQLTGLYNRDYLQDSYDYHSRSSEPLALILIDVDHFKQVNDNFGHLTGDFVLQSLAELIGSNIRKTDILARWGGEEFVILCPNSTAGQARILAEKLRVIIHDHIFDTIGNITCSFGISSALAEDNKLKDLFERADQALYQSKNTGRNQVNSR